MRTLLGFVMLAIASTANARLGETLDECKARYGELISIKPDKTWPHHLQHIFRKGNVEIRVRFLEGKSGQEIFYAADGVMTDDQIREILLGNAQGSQWRRLPDPPPDADTYSRQMKFKRDDGLAHAEYFRMATIANDSLTMSTFAIDKAMNERGSGF